MNAKAVLDEKAILEYDNYILLRIFYMCVCILPYRDSLTVLIPTFLFVHLHLHIWECLCLMLYS